LVGAQNFAPSINSQRIKRIVKKVAKDPAEWLNQADYDLDTAKDMLDKG
jgi:uncharacterized circularly permuted ATP-grasp superfamily protein